MEALFGALLIGVAGSLNILCFLVGAKVGQASVKGREIKIPNPVKEVKSYRESREYKKAQEEIETMLENINNYDGTGMNQKEV